MKFMAEITDGYTKMETACTLPEMLTAITVIIHDTWEHLPNDEIKDLFRAGFEKAMKDGLPFLTDEERENLVKKQKAELEDNEDNMDEFGGKLKELLKGLKGLLDDD